MFAILVISLCFLHHTIAANLTLREIFQSSKDAIESNNVGDIDKVLNKYYFTDIKDTSVWWVAQREAYSAFRIDLAYENLSPMETGIKKLKDHYILCSGLDFDQDRSYCFYKSNDLIKAIKRDFMWDISPDISKEGKAKLGTLFISFTALSYLLATISSDNIKHIKDEVTKSKWIGEISRSLTKFSDTLHDYERDITTWRVDQISAVEICGTNKYFWKEFVGTCETRWRRSVELESKDESNKEKFEYPNLDDPALDIADKIGGNSNDFQKIFKGTVTDNVQNKVLFEKEAYVSLKDIRGNKLNKLIKEGNEKRGDHERDIRSFMDRFNNNSTKIVRGLIAAYHKNFQTSK